MSAATLPRLPARHVAVLRAVDAGRVEVTCSCLPDLYVDGRCCTDHTVGRELTRLGLIGRVDEAEPGARVPARLTPAGVAVLAEVTS